MFETKSLKGILLSLTAAVLVSACQMQNSVPAAGQIEQAVQEAAKTQGFSGTVLVMRKGEVLYRSSHGQAISNDSRFLAASLAKPFTAVLIFQLIEDGKLKLGDRLDAVFPELTGKPAGAITIEQLLSHTSGIEEVTEQHPTRPLTAADLVTARLTTKPGDFAYSSAGYVVLKLVIEKASGQDYATRLSEKILVPAGMTRSGLMRQGAVVPDLAVGYGASGNAPATLAVPIEILDGAGSLYTTADDLARFDKASSGNVILSAESQKLMYARHTPEGSTAWGYGWALADQGGKLYPWHKGDLPGYTAVMARQIHRDELVVILSNREKADLTPMRQKILRILKATAD